MQSGSNEPPRTKPRRLKKRFVLLLLVSAVVVAGLWAFLSRPSIPDGSVLVLDLAAPLEERSPDGLTRWIAGSEIDIVDLWRSLRAAAKDPRVEGLVLKIHAGSVRSGTVDELRGLVLEFQKSGKRAIAHLNAPDTLGYLLGTAAREVLLDPSTTLDSVGIRMNAYFLKDALGALGVEADLVRVGSFKGAFEELAQSAPTPELEASLSELVGSLYKSILEPIAAERKLDVNALRAIFDRAPLQPDEALALKLVDGLATQEELTKRTEEKAGKALHWIGMEEYRATLAPARKARRIALVHILGTMVEGESRDLPWIGLSSGADTVTKAIRAASLDPGVDGILLRIDSPGGVVSAAEKVQLAVEAARKSKPVVASCGGAAASGGYYAACSAELILAHPTTLTGSIGIFGGKIVIRDLLARLKVEARTYSGGQRATLNDFTRSFTAEERLAIKSLLESSYRRFVDRVAVSRKKSFEAIDNVAQGRVWTGRAALDVGLVDRMGGLVEAVSSVVELARLDRAQAVELELFPPRQTLWDAISKPKRSARGAEQGLGSLALDVICDLRALQEAGLFNGLASMAWLPFLHELK